MLIKIWLILPLRDFFRLSKATLQNLIFCIIFCINPVTIGSLSIFSYSVLQFLNFGLQGQLLCKSTSFISKLFKSIHGNISKFCLYEFCSSSNGLNLVNLKENWILKLNQWYLKIAYKGSECFLINFEFCHMSFEIWGTLLPTSGGLLKPGYMGRSWENWRQLQQQK